MLPTKMDSETLLKFSRNFKEPKLTILPMMNLMSCKLTNKMFSRGRTILVSNNLDTTKDRELIKLLFQAVVEAEDHQAMDLHSH